MKTAQVRKNELVYKRITARVPTLTRSIIERAAAISGSTINQFIVQAAVERANEVLKSMEVLNLTTRDAKAFLDALTNPPQPNTRLRNTVRAHGRLVESRG